MEDALFWGAVSLERGPGWVKPWRIPHEDLVLFPPDGVGGTAQIPAGVRLGFLSETRSVRLDWVPIAQAVTVDCVVDDRLVGGLTAPPGVGSACLSKLAPGRKRLELYLSQSVGMRLTGLWVDDGASATPLAADRPRWVTYGSSITQCRQAASPAETWPALVARRNALDLTCLGFAGNCHLEPMVARLLRDRPADLISLCLGINVQGGCTLAPRTFRPAVIGFVRLVREGHPRVPIAVLSPILSPPRETTPNAVGLSLTHIRSEIAAAVEALRERGDDDVHYVDGLGLFGPDAVDHLPDRLHPDAEGYRVLSRNFQRMVAEPIFGLTPPGPAEG